MEPEILVPTEADFSLLWKVNPLAWEQLHWITVERLLREARGKLGATDAGPSPKSE